MESHIPRLLAEKELRDRATAGPVTADRYRDLIFAVTGDADEANRQQAWMVLNLTKDK